MNNKDGPKILFYDVETSPNIVYTYDLWNAYIGQEKIIEPSRLLCWSASWLDSDQVMFDSEHISGRKTMLRGIHALINEADILVSYNGDKFDIKVLNAEFILNGIDPPKPVESVDLYKVVKKAFRFPSNKLAFVVKALDIGEKKDVTHGTWVRCLHGDNKAWKEIEEYNKHDTILLKPLYKKVLGWTHRHPNYGLYTESVDTHCPCCGSGNVVQRGFRRTKTRLYKRYRCNSCGKWSSSRLSERTDSTKELLV